jgi:YbbR domain-containing protein
MINSLTHKKIFTNNLSLKIVAFIAAYSLWACFAPRQIIDQTIKVPISFYNVPAGLTVHAAETVTLTVRAKRSTLAHLCASPVIINIDATAYKPGTIVLPVQTEQLLLPPGVTMVDCTTTTITITVQPETLQ